MISFENISKQYGDKTLFDNASFSVNEKYCTALIGPNGSGKTTLLRMIQNIEYPDRGAVSVPKNLTTGWLPQEVETFSGATPLDTVLEPFRRLLQYEQALEGASGDIKSIGELEEEMRLHDGWSLQSRAEMILAGLGVPQKSWREPLESLSGGYRMRAALGRLLLQNPDYMLLDEPTNHLDMDSLIWLEKFLSSYRGGMLVVSHDRDFLNRMCTHTADIRAGSVRVFNGNYDKYIVAKREEDAAAEARTKNLEQKIASAERFVERFKAKATKATQAQSRVKMIENLKAELPAAEIGQKTIRFTFTCSCEPGSVPLRLKNCSAGYGDKIVLGNVDLEISRGDKVAIIGPNGAGKSTLLKLLAGAIKPMGGEMILGHNAELRYFGQHQLEQLNGEDTLYDTVARTASSSDRNYIRNALGAFLFGGTSIEKQVKVLSGGEKSRLALAAILASPGNVLLLDEPTNHLDITSIEMLSESMADYKGTILFVSHDEYFISKLATRIIEVRPGKLRDFPGNLSDYRYYMDTLFKDAESAAASPSSLRKNAAGQAPESEKEIRMREREERKKRERETLKLEQEIEQREQEISRHKSILNDPANALNYELLHTATENIARLKMEVDGYMERWLGISG